MAVSSDGVGAIVAVSRVYRHGKGLPCRDGIMFAAEIMFVARCRVHAHSICKDSRLSFL